MTGADRGQAISGSENVSGTPRSPPPPRLKSREPSSTSPTSATSTLYGNGVKVGENDDPPSGEKPFEVGSADADYG